MSKEKKYIFLDNGANRIPNWLKECERRAKMNKAILISIKPKWCAKIMNGDKTIEIRKTCPRIFKNLKPYEGCSIDVYIYCTKDKETIAINPYGGYATIPNKYKNEYFNGKVVAKFTLNKVEEIPWQFGVYELDKQSFSDFLDKCCLDFFELKKYLNKNNGYAWHISNLEIFNEPKELSEFRVFPKVKSIETDEDFYLFTYGNPLTKAPQNFCYVEVDE